MKSELETAIQELDEKRRRKFLMAMGYCVVPLLEEWGELEPVGFEVRRADEYEGIDFDLEENAIGHAIACILEDSPEVAFKVYESIRFQAV